MGVFRKTRQVASPLSATSGRLSLSADRRFVASSDIVTNKANDAPAALSLSALTSQYFTLLHRLEAKIDLRAMTRKRSKLKAVREDRPMLLSRRESEVVVPTLRTMIRIYESQPKTIMQKRVRNSGAGWCGIFGDKRSGRKRAHTIEEMKALAAKKGGLCLSDSYKNHKSRLRWRCTANHEWETQASVILGGHWCPKCQSLRLASRYAVSLGEVQSTAAARGGACLSTDYLNNRQKLAWQCSNGHVWNANANSVRRGSWCPTCANGRRSMARRRGSQRLPRG